MRKLLALTVLVLTVLSTPVFADWTKVGKNVDGDTYYVDFERIRKHGGFVYFWRLDNLVKPTKYGNLSGKTYIKGDCDDIFFKLFRHKYLNALFHKEPMGRGTPSTTYKPKNPEWKIPRPNSTIETILKSVCRYVK
jgi:hypothetical protein